jgi:hypothetical protein
MAKYKALQACFIAPVKVLEGTVFTIDDGFQPGPHLEPLDDAAKAAMEKYLKANPEATLHPVETLVHASPEIVSAPVPDTTVELSLAEAAAAPAKPGLTDGGKADASTK